MDLMNNVSPTMSITVNYEAANNLTSSVKADLFSLKDAGEAKLLVVGTEIEANNGPSITNSIEEFAKRVRTLFPTFDSYHFIECYRWPGEKPTFDKVVFIEDGFEKPTWTRLNDYELHHLVDYINSHQVEELHEELDTSRADV